MRIGIVTATTNMERAKDCIESWFNNAVHTPLIYLTANGTDGKGYMGSVPAFEQGMNTALSTSDCPEIIACLHDDFEIHESRWDEKVIRHFERHPKCGLAGFGGAIGLGAEAIYREPYNPMQLARIGFRSNLVDAETHGTRSLLPERVACLDGFSQVGRRSFWDGHRRLGELGGAIKHEEIESRPWTVLKDLGFVHHFYDGALGCLAARMNWETWYIPLRGKHFGGRTAVGDQGYANWAKTQHPDGDHGFWERAHQIGYESFRDVLPIRL